VEPFVGAGSVFLASDYDSYLLNDANPDLVAVWSALQQRPKVFMNAAASFFRPENDAPGAYYRIRDEFNAATERFERAIRLPFLNKFGFNGLFRVNRQGDYNVPFGRRSSTPVFPWPEMECAAQKLERCIVTSGGFEAAMESAGYGDAVYCDPPYLPSAGGDSFTAYTKDGFTLSDQRRLVELAQQANARGATVIISNHDTPLTRELYRGFALHSLQVRRSVAGDGGSRDNVPELIAVLRP